MTTKTRVLVVDDEEDAREMLAAILTQAGFDVDDAADGFAALSKVSHYRPDVVVTDLRMPGMTGVDLLQRIRRIHGDVPVILATGLETWDLCTAAEAYGAVTCLDQAGRARRAGLDTSRWRSPSARMLAAGGGDLRPTARRCNPDRTPA